MARTIGKRNIKKVKEMIDQARREGMTGISAITDKIIERLPGSVFDIWESSYSEVERICHDYIMKELNT